MAIAENPDRATDSQWDWVADRPSRGLAPAADAALHFDAVRAVKVGVCPLVLPDSRSRSRRVSTPADRRPGQTLGLITPAGAAGHLEAMIFSVRVV